MTTPEIAEPPRAITRRLSLEIDPVAESRLREMQRQVERKTGSAISLGDLVSAFIHEAWETGQVPGPATEPEVAEAAPAPAIGATGEATATGGANATGEATSTSATSATGKASATNATGEAIETIATSPAPSVESAFETAREGPSDDLGSGREARAGTRRGRAIPLPPRGILEVVFRQEGDSRLFTATSAGLVQVPAYLLQRLPSLKVDYESLLAEASAAAQGADGEHIPAAVRRAVLARSGGRCETAGCGRRVASLNRR